jgi:hypothetical protein
VGDAKPDERARTEQAIAALEAERDDADSEQGEPGEFGSQELYEKERDSGLAAVERAEAHRWAPTGCRS